MSLTDNILAENTYYNHIRNLYTCNGCGNKNRKNNIISHIFQCKELNLCNCGLRIDHNQCEYREECLHCNKVLYKLRGDMHMDDCPNKPLVLICGHYIGQGHADGHYSECASVKICCYCNNKVNIIEIDNHANICLKKPFVVKCGHTVIKELFVQHEMNCQDMPYTCEYCNLQITCGKKDAHFKECVLFPINCKFCNIIFERKNVDLHEKTCQNSLYECKCGCTIRRSTILEHISSCYYYMPVKCPYFGCNMEDQRHVMKNHIFTHLPKNTYPYNKNIKCQFCNANDISESHYDICPHRPYLCACGKNPTQLTVLNHISTCNYYATTKCPYLNCEYADIKHMVYEHIFTHL
jgi:hypothetical protein